MTTLQKIIRYLAIALAIFIIVSIASGILLGLNIFSDVLGLKKEAETNKQHTNLSEGSIIQKYESTQISDVKIELAYTNLTIKQGDGFVVEGDIKNVECKRVSNKLKIEEKNISWFNTSDRRNIIVTVPEDTILNTVDIETGAGEINIEKLSCKELSLEIGAGKTTIQDLQVTQKAKINGGAGKVEIASGEINNLNLSMGAGNFRIAASLSGNNKLDAGIGKLGLELTNGLSNYTIRANKGIGSIKIGEKEVFDNVEYGDGETNIKINGGVGSIEVK